MMFQAVVLATFFFYVGFADGVIPENTTLSRKIVGGWAGEDHPFVIMIGINHKTLYGMVEYGHCGGSFIAQYWIITAAHCMKDLRYVNLCTTIHIKMGFGGREIFVEDVFRHPDFDGDNNDIALIHTQGDSFGSTPVKLATTTPPIHTKSTLIGRGRLGIDHPNEPHVYRVVDVYTTPCGGNVFINQSNVDNVERFNESSILCTSTEDGRGGCLGDTGGPLVIEKQPGEYTLIGILSNGWACAVGVPDIYTDVSFYNKWINETLHNNPVNHGFLEKICN